jgi:hypothetical protein
LTREGQHVGTIFSAWEDEKKKRKKRRRKEIKNFFDHNLPVSSFTFEQRFEKKSGKERHDRFLNQSPSAPGQGRAWVARH